MNILEIKENAIVFKTVIRKRVPYVPRAMVRRAEKFARDTGREIISVEGDFHTTRFIVDIPYGFDEIMEIIGKF